MTNVLAVANRVTGSTDIAQVERDLDGVPLIGQIPYDEAIAAGALTRDADGAPQPTAAMTSHAATIESITAALGQ